MATFEAFNQKLQAHIAEKYRKQPLLEQKIVQLCSVIYEPFTITSLVNCLERASIYDDKSKLFVSKTLTPYIDKLIADGSVVQEQKLGYRCHPLLMEIATRDAVKSGDFPLFASSVALGQPIRVLWEDGPRNFQNDFQFIREVRIGLYSQDLNFINKQVEDYQKFGFRENKLSLEEVLLEICNNPFDGEWFSSLPENLYDHCIWIVLNHSLLNFVPANEAFATFQEECFKSSGLHNSERLRLLLTEQLLLRGCIQEAQETLESLPEDYLYNTSPYWGWLCFLQGDNSKAIAHFIKGLGQLKKAAGKRQVYFQTTGGLFYILALIKEGSPKSLQVALEHTSWLARQSEHWLRIIYYNLKVLLQVQSGEVSQKRFILEGRIAFPGDNKSLEVLFLCLCHYWVDTDNASMLSGLLEQYYQQGIASGYHWLGMEAAELLSRIKPESSYETQAEILREDIGIEHSIVDVIKPTEEWEQCLSALANINSTAIAAQPKSENRMAWFITYHSNNSYTIQAKEQKINKKGEWSRGRPIALKRLRNTGEFDYLTPQDLRICGCVEVHYDTYYYGKSDYRFNTKTICALIGHPLVFWDDTAANRVEIVKGEPELIVKKSRQGKLSLEISPKLKEDQKVLTIKETPTRIKVIEITPEHLRIAEILGHKINYKCQQPQKNRF